jgi:CDP-4-dehydro-6-deoxyglucose reductase
MNYSCTSGSCGECKARIVSGDYEVSRHFDYPLSEAEKLQNMALMCSINAKSDLVIEATEARSAADIPLQSIKAKVAKIEAIDNDNMVLHVRTPRSKTLRFLAGQHITLTVKGAPPRDLAVASCPCNGMVLQFHIQRRKGDEFSEFVFNRLRQSDNVLIEGPFGEFTLDESSKRALVLIGVDTGFAVLKSLVEHAIALELDQSMYLFWIARAGRRHYLSNYCRAWEDALDNFVFIPLQVDSQLDETAAYQRITEEIIARSPPEREIDLYIAGPPEISQPIAGAYQKRGTPVSRIGVTSAY